MVTIMNFRFRDNQLLTDSEIITIKEHTMTPEDNRVRLPQRKQPCFYPYLWGIFSLFFFCYLLPLALIYFVLFLFIIPTFLTIVIFAQYYYFLLHRFWLTLQQPLFHPTVFGSFWPFYIFLPIRLRLFMFIHLTA